LSPFLKFRGFEGIVLQIKTKAESLSGRDHVEVISVPKMTDLGTSEMDKNTDRLL